jgi:hypothetical protein
MLKLLAKIFGIESKTGAVLATANLAFIGVEAYSILSDGLEEASSEEVALLSLDVALLLFPLIGRKKALKRAQDSYKPGMAMYKKHGSIHKSKHLQRFVAPKVSSTGITVYDTIGKSKKFFRFGIDGKSIHFGSRIFKLPEGFDWKIIAGLGGIWVSVYLAALALADEALGTKGTLINDLMNTIDSSLDNKRSMYDQLHRFESSGAHRLWTKYATMIEDKLAETEKDASMLIISKAVDTLKHHGSAKTMSEFSKISSLSSFGDRQDYPLKPPYTIDPNADTAWRLLFGEDYKTFVDGIEGADEISTGKEESLHISKAASMRPLNSTGNISSMINIAINS